MRSFPSMKEIWVWKDMSVSEWQNCRFQLNHSFTLAFIYFLLCWIFFYLIQNDLWLKLTRCMTAWMQSRPKLFLLRLILNSVILLWEWNDKSVCKEIKPALSQSKMKGNIEREGERERKKIISSQISFQSNIQATIRQHDSFCIIGNGTGSRQPPRQWSQTLIKNVIIPPALMVSNHTVTVWTEWNLDKYDPLNSHWPAIYTAT